MADLLLRLQGALADRYAIERELGRGGMSIVYLARDLKHERSVALKVLRPEVGAALGPERFLREIRLTAHLQHPHILPLLDSAWVNTLLYYVMPYVAGESLRARLSREQELPLEDALQITREVADAIGYAHRQGVVHRDIKPENILLDEGHAVVTDFGIARAVAAAAVDRLTETGLAIGTPSYMSPEQATSRGVLDGRSDIYSLGCVLYEMLTGEPPYKGPNAQAVIAKQLSEPVPRLPTLREIPKEVERAVRKALAKAPADRFRTAAEFVAAVEGTGRSRLFGGRRRFVVLTGASVLVVGILAWLARGAVSGARTRAPARPLLVVLPFENLGPPGDAYFADGITEEITSRLAQLSGLGVIARTSAMQYRNAHKSIRQIGEELGVSYVIEGSVRWEKPPSGPGRVRVSPQLIRVADETHVWSEPYDAVLADVFRVQGDIAGQVAQALNVTLLPVESTAVASQPTSNLEAYDLFLRAEAYSSPTSTSAPERVTDAWHAIELYRQAVERDSTFALAYARLAIAYDDDYWHVNRTDARREQAEQAAVRAVALQPRLAEAHLARGMVYYHGHRDYDRALREFALAGGADAMQRIGWIERRRGQWDAAAADLTQAAALNPRDAGPPLELGVTYLSLRRYTEAEPVLRRATELSANSLAYERWAWLQLCRNGSAERARAIMSEAASRVGIDTVVAELVALGPDWTHGIFRFLGEDYQRALEHLSLSRTLGEPGYHFEAKAALYSRLHQAGLATAYSDSARAAWEGRLRIQPDEAWYHSMLGIALARLGRKEDAVREGRTAIELLPAAKDAVDGPKLVWNLAEIYLLVGANDAAVDQLGFLLTIPYPLSPALLRVDPLWAPLRGNPRFERLLKGGA